MSTLKTILFWIISIVGVFGALHEFGIGGAVVTVVYIAIVRSWACGAWSLSWLLLLPLLCAYKFAAHYGYISMNGYKFVMGAESIAGTVGGTAFYMFVVWWLSSHKRTLRSKQPTNPII